MTETEIAGVADTSFWVAYYRARESERSDALFKDPYAKALVGDKGKRISDSMARIGRYTEWSVLSRTVIIDRFIEAAIKDGVDAVVNLGAGLDSRPYRMNLPANLQWVEADYASIVDHKTKVLQHDKPRCKLLRVAVDLAADVKRKDFLNSVVPDAKKVLVLTEGVIPYLAPEQVAALAADLKDQARFAYWITEYFHPKVYRYLQNRELGDKLKNAPFRFYPDDWYGFFKNLGWVEKETRYSGEIALEFHRKLPMPKWVEFLMPIIPKKAKEQSIRMAGYILFKKA